MTRYLLAELGDGDGLEKDVYKASRLMEENAFSSAGDLIVVYCRKPGDVVPVHDPAFAWRLTGLRVLDQDVHYVLQGLYPKGWHNDKNPDHLLPLTEDTWLDVMSLASWKDPEVRAEVLADMRNPALDEPGHPSPVKQWHMVRRIHTEVVLGE